jgi:hypothetical protein
MIRSGIVVAILAVWLFSCTRSDTRHVVYYPVDSLIQAQINYLADPQHPAFLHKFATLGTHQDTVLYQPRDSAAWASELGPLLRLGVINKPIHQGKYAVEDNLPDPGSNLRIRAYKAQDAGLPIEYLKIYYRDSLKHIRRIEGAYREVNALYTSTQVFTMELQEVHNKIMLTSYSIRGGQKMILADSMLLDVDGRIALDMGVNNIIDSYGKKNREGTVEGGREAETQ